MKRFLIPLLAVLALPTTVEANWFGYGSKYEAIEACNKWARKGFKYQYQYYEKTFNGNSRKCRLEADTNQILGFEKKGLKRKLYTPKLVQEELNYLKDTLKVLL